MKASFNGSGVSPYFRVGGRLMGRFTIINEEAEMELERGDERCEEFEQKKALCRPIQMCSASEKAEKTGWTLLCEVMGELPIKEYARGFAEMEAAYKEINNTTELPPTYRSAKSVLWRGAKSPDVIIWEDGTARGKSDVERQLREAKDTDAPDSESLWRALGRAKNRHFRELRLEMRTHPDVTESRINHAEVRMVEWIEELRRIRR